MKNIKLCLFIVLACLQMNAQPGTIVVGTNDGTPNTSDDGPSPLQDFNKTQKAQYLYTASELAVAGLSAGNITSIGWVVTDLNGSGLQENYTIKIKSTPATFLTNAFETGGVVVYGPTDYTPTATGNVLFPLTTPFDWDGTSNLIIEVCSGSASGTYTENVSCANASTSGNKTSYSNNDDEPSPCTVSEADSLSNQRPLLVVTGNVSSCLPPINVVTGGITSSSAVVTWDEITPIPEVGYEYVVSTSSSAPTSPGTSTISTFANVTGLLPQTKYYVFIRSVCTTGSTSLWNGLTTFTTNCDIVTSFTQNFENVTSLDDFPSCWAKVGNGGNAFIFNNEGSYEPNALYMVSFVTNELAVVATQQVSNLGSGTHRIKFKVKADYEVRCTMEFGYLADPANDRSFVPLTSFATTSTTYQSFQFSPSAGVYSNYPAFRHTGIVGIGILIDNVVWETIPTCLDVEGLAVGGITSSGANISWDISTGVIGYEYAVTTSITPPLGGTSTTGTSASITSLVPQTVYYLHVRSACTGNNFGAWSTTIFTTETECVPSAAPTIEPFNTFLPTQCWSEGIGGNLTTGPETYGYSSWYEDGFANAGVTGSIAYNQYDLDSNDWIISPQYTIPAVGYQLKFDVALTQRNETSVPTTSWDAGDGMQVLVSTTGYTNWSMLYTVDNSNQPPPTGSPIIINLDAYASQTIRIAYRIVSGTTDGNDDTDIFVDNFQLRLAPLCNGPLNLVASGITSSTVNISWTSTTPPPAMGYEYFISTSSSLPVTSGTATTNTFNAITNGLLPQTTYYAFVRSNCNTLGFSEWTGPISFKTLCAPITTLPWTEGFEGVTIPNIPKCWFNENGDYETSSDFEFNDAHAGSNYLRNQFGPTNEFIWTRGFTLTSGTSYDFSSFIQGDNGTSWTVDYFVNVSPTSAGATQLGATYSVPGTGNNYEPQEYENVTRSFIPSATGTYYFGIKVNEPTGDPNSLAFDDFELKLSPYCTPPTAVLSNITDTSATVGWTSFSAAAVGYEYVLNTIAANPSGNGISTTVLNYSESGLTPATTYYFHIRSVCSASEFSEWSTFSFTTSCAVASIPYTQDFESAVVPNLPLCTTQQNIGAGNLWEVANNEGFGFTTKALRYSLDSEADANVWFFTNGINLVSGTNYQIAYDYGSTGEEFPERLKVAYGTSPTSTAMTTLLADHPNVINGTTPINNIVNFTPTTSGVYYFGFNAYSLANQYALFVDNISLDVALANNSFDNNNVLVYPNPVKNILNINHNENISKIQILNILGQEITTKSVNDIKSQIDMSGLVQGTYLVKITSNDLVTIIKVIKE